MKTHDFYYDLPEELIAQTPLKDRDTSRLMVLDRITERFPGAPCKTVGKPSYRRRSGIAAFAGSWGRSVGMPCQAGQKMYPGPGNDLW